MGVTDIEVPGEDQRKENLPRYSAAFAGTADSHSASSAPQSNLGMPPNMPQPPPQMYFLACSQTGIVQFGCCGGYCYVMDD